MGPKNSLSVYTFTVKRLLNVNPKIFHDVVYGDTSRFLISVHATLMLAILGTFDKTKLIKYHGKPIICCYNYTRRCARYQNSYWCGYLWLNHYVQNVRLLHRVFKQFLLDFYKEYWHQHVWESSRFIAYITLKPRLQLNQICTMSKNKIKIFHYQVWYGNFRPQDRAMSTK